jgi:hypothetical protein
MAFSLVPDEEEVNEVAEKLVGDVLRRTLARYS